MFITNVHCFLGSTFLGLEADVAARGLHEEVAWDVAGPRPHRGARKEMRAKKLLEAHRNAGIT